MRVLLSCVDKRDESALRRRLKAPDIEVVSHPPKGWQGKLPAFDGLIAVLSGPRGTLARVFRDIGYAEGRDSPVLVLADEASFAELIPTAAVLLGGLKNETALRFHIDTFVETLRRPPERTLHPPVKPESFDWARSELVDIRGTDRQTSAAALFEQTVEEVLRRAGATVHALYPDGPFDLAVSVPNLEIASGPVAVECKRAKSAQGIAASARRLRQQVEQRNGELGLIIYDRQLLDRPLKLTPVDRVVTLDIEELLTSLERSSLADAISGARRQVEEDA